MGRGHQRETANALVPLSVRQRVYLVLLQRDDFSSHRHPAPGHCWSMIFSEKRHPLLGITLRSFLAPRRGVIGMCFAVRSLFEPIAINVVQLQATKPYHLKE